MMVKLTRVVRACALLLVLTLDAALLAQARHPVTDRVIAPVMSVEGHAWLDRPEREREESTAQAMTALQVRPGMVVADIGAGSGYYTIRLAKAVGPTGRVFATDIQRGMLDLIEKRMREEHLANVTTVLGTEVDPSLAAQSLDLALMVDVYHELQQPQAFMRRLREALKADGRLALLEFRKEDPSVPIREEHKMSVSDTRRELGADGFTFRESIEKLPWQHLMIFARR
jgi:predicted methyltransferase